MAVAAVRDWGRLGLMLAHKGTWSGNAIVPEKWLAAATTRQLEVPSPAYGYQIWLSGDDDAPFYLSGRHGQFVMVDPRSRTTLVQTALDASEWSSKELGSLWLAVLAGSR